MTERKEATDGGIDWTHTYNVLDAYATYATWVNQLAFEFGGTDELLELEDRRDSAPDEGGLTRNIVQAWLLREAASVQLEQARYSLKFGLAGHARMLTDFNDHDSMSVAELARSLYTDRPNLSKVIKAAEKDREMMRVLDVLHSGDRDEIREMLT